MERYNEYKDSGVQWLGEIPSHWELRKMKYTFCERSQKGFPNEPLLAATQNHGVIKKSDYENRTVEATKNLDTLKLVEKGDFVISLRSFQGGIEYSYCRGIISPAYTVLKAHHLTEPYFKHLAKSPSFIDLLKSSVTGIREGQNIDYNKLKVEFMPIPAIEEQQAIATYLDAITAKIDEAIAQQQKMIDLLNERKQIIINNAVTKGLNPDVPMKDSGVDWIGEIPEHWEFVKLKRYCKIRTGKTPSTTKEYYFENGDIKWFTPGDLNKFELVDSERKVTYRAQLEQACNMFPANTVYLVGIGGTIGKVGFCETEATCNQQINAIIPNCKKINHKYLAHLTQSTKVQILRLANFSTLPIINQDRTGSLNIVVPPISEQESIVNILENKSAPINAAIKAAEKQISLLQERKKIIINDVVTGKVKVC